MRLIKVNKMPFAEYKDNITVSGLSDDQMCDLKQRLTFDNPAYSKAQRYSGRKYTKYSPYLTYYDNTCGNLSVPIGTDLSDLNIKSRSDDRVFPKVNVPQFVLELRDDQKKAAKAYFDKNINPYELNGIIQMPTGKGKSILGLYLAYALSTRTLVVVHKDDLVRGWINDIKLAFNNKVIPGIIKAKKRSIGGFITIATVQTLGNLSEKDLELLYGHFGLVIQDEVHHCPATSFEVVNHFYPRYRLGLSATPEREDGLTHVMRLYYGGTAYVVQVNENDKDILPVDVIVKNLPVYCDPVCKRVKNKWVLSNIGAVKNFALCEDEDRITNIPYNERPRVSFQDLNSFALLNSYEAIARDVQNEYNLGHSCIVFFSKKDQVRSFHSVLKRLIDPSRIGVYYGDSSSEENNRVLSLADKIRQFVTLTTYAKSTEGTNVKQWEVEFLASSSNSGKNVEQAIGRVRRSKQKDKLTRAKVYDYRYPYVYSLKNHGRTRDSRYRKLKFRILRDEVWDNKLFSKGYISR